ncbi:MAG: UbiA-like polyprenyltransferase [Bryobacteraceae bacterium]|nr:UbiA-like polyprenyltransferase [Bryobacteraceae bacterium]
MLRKLKLTLDMIKFEHSIFALPFAATGALLAIRESSFAVAGLPGKLWWILLCMVSARSAAMAFNRILDRDIDARNPRTAMRHLPAGLLSRDFAILFTVVSAAIFALSAAQLNLLCAALSPVALAIVFGYSYTKRFTSLAHLVLGFALGIAPAAAWIAIRGSLDARILWLTLAVTLWTAGFDIIYSCQDIDFDRRSGLSSIPARLGVADALNVARALHFGMIGALVALSGAFWLGALSWAGIAVVAALLIYEHSLVKADDLSRVNAAFFTVNGYVGILFFAFWASDMLWRR